MKMMLMKTISLIAMMSTMLKNPMSMGLTLLMQTTLIIMMMNTMNNSSWIPLITFLTMIGGLMIIFMYMSSITSNEKFRFTIKLMLPLMLTMIISEELMLNFPNQEFQTPQSGMDNMMSMNKMYSKSMLMTMMMIMYLLLTMIAVNKIIKMFEGPLRSSTYE